MDQISPLLAFAQDKLQIAALLVMATAYVLKVRWILRFPAGRDRQAPTGTGDAERGAWLSLFNIGTSSGTQLNQIVLSSLVVVELLSGLEHPVKVPTNEGHAVNQHLFSMRRRGETASGKRCGGA